MIRPLLLLIITATLALHAQDTPPKAQVGTVTAVSVHQNENDDGPLQYDVSLQVKDTVYIVLFTPPSGSKGVEYGVGQNVVVLIGDKSISFTKLGTSAVVPILSRHTVPARASDGPPAPVEYFSEKTQELLAKLDLSPDQEAKIKPIFQEETNRSAQVATSSPLSREEKLNQLEKITRSSDQKLKPLLSETQVEMLQDVRKDQKREAKEFIESREKH